MIANRFVSSWSYAELAEMQPTPSITLTPRSWPLNAPVKPDDAIFFLITTSKSCYDQEVAGGPYHVIGTTLQPIASVVGATGRVDFHSTLELLKVLPKLPTAMRAHMDAVQVCGRGTPAASDGCSVATPRCVLMSTCAQCSAVHCSACTGTVGHAGKTHGVSVTSRALLLPDWPEVLNKLLRI
jgi:hypothetical protein